MPIITITTTPNHTRSMPSLSATGPSSGSCGTAAFRSQRVICRDVQSDPLWTPFRPFAADHGIASAWSTPMLDRDGNLLGVFGMYYGDPRSPSKEELAVVGELLVHGVLAYQGVEVRLAAVGLGP